jgi:adenylate cyclase
MSQLAHASASAFRVNVDADSYDADVRLLGVVQRNLATDAFIETYLALAGQLFRHSARLSIRGDTVAAGELGELVFMTVGFVDLAASTELSQRTTVRELATLMAEFNDAVFGTASRHAVRVVKTIGDEAMLAADDPAAVALVALELVAYFGEHPAFGGARGGLAAGDVLDQDGDLYGPVVNRAARLVEAAADGTVMADETVGARLGARVGFEAAPIATHRGIGPTGWGRVRPGPLSSSRG